MLINGLGAWGGIQGEAPIWHRRMSGVPSTAARLCALCAKTGWITEGKTEIMQRTPGLQQLAHSQRRLLLFCMTPRARGDIVALKFCQDSKTTEGARDDNNDDDEDKGKETDGHNSRHGRGRR